MNQAKLVIFTLVGTLLWTVVFYFIILYPYLKIGKVLQYEKEPLLVTTVTDKNDSNNRTKYDPYGTKRDDHQNSTTSYLSELKEKISVKTELDNGDPVIAVLVISCNRVTISRTLDQLIKWRPSQDQFPIIVSQDCEHEATTRMIHSYGDQLILIKHPNQSDIIVPVKEKRFMGYFKIARHYGWALNQIFQFFEFETAIIVEDDLDIASDFYEYFLGTHWLLKKDPTLWCVSGWNDNGKPWLVDINQPELLYRTDFFPGLGWMLLSSMWKELQVKWPKSYWDDWIREPEQRKGRACIRPELPRTKTFGRKGVSKGLFYETHLKRIKLNEKFVKFTQKNLSYLLKDDYDLEFVRKVYGSKIISYEELRRGAVHKTGSVRVMYHSKQEYQIIAKRLNLMEDYRNGVQRTAYRGVISFFYRGQRSFLAPSLNWTSYIFN